MTNAINLETYNKIKNDYSFSVVSFKDNYRELTYGNLTYVSAIKEILLKQSYGYECLIIKNLPEGEYSRDRKDYDKYLKIEEEN